MTSHDSPDLNESVRVVLVTAPAQEVGQPIASALVEERLAASVNLVLELTSTCRIGEEVKRDEEVLSLNETCNPRCDSLAARVRELHPYELPEVLALPAVGGDPASVAWVTAEASP